MINRKETELEIRCNELGEELKDKKQDLESVTKINYELKLETEQLEKWVEDSTVAFEEMQRIIRKDRRKIDKLLNENSYLTQNQQYFLSSNYKTKKLIKLEQKKEKSESILQNTLSQLAGTAESVSDIESKLEDSQQIQKDQREQISDLLAKKETSNTEYQRLAREFEESAARKDQEVERLILEKDSFRVEVEQAQSQLAGVNESASDIGSKLEDSQQIQKDQREQISDLLSKTETSKTEYQKLAREFEESVTQKDQEIERFELENDTFRVEVEQAQSQLAVANESVIDIGSMLEDNLQIQENQRKQISDQLAKTETSKTEYQRLAKEFEESATRKDQEIERLELENDLFIVDVEQVQGQLTWANESIIDIGSNLEVSLQIQENQREQISDLLAKTETSNTEYQKLAREFEESVTQKDQEIERLELKNDSFRVDVEQAQSQLAGSTENVSDIGSKLEDSLQIQANQREQVSDLLAEYQRLVREFEESAARKDQEIERLELENDTFRVEVEQAQSKLTGSTESVSDIGSKLEDSLQIQENQREQISDLLAKIETSKTEYQKLARELNEVRSRMQNQINDISQELDEKRKILNISEQEVISLQIKLINTEKALAKQLELSLIPNHEGVEEKAELEAAGHNLSRELNEVRSRMQNQINDISQELDEKRNILNISEQEVISLQIKLINTEKVLAEQLELSLIPNDEGVKEKAELEAAEHNLCILMNTMDLFLTDISAFFNDETNNFWKLKISELKELTHIEGV